MVMVVGILSTVGLQGLLGATASFSEALYEGPWSVIGWGLFLALGLAGYWIGLRVAFSMVQLRLSGVVIRNVFRTRSVRWEDVERFSGPWDCCAASARRRPDRDHRALGTQRGLSSEPSFCADDGRPAQF